MIDPYRQEIALRLDQGYDLADVERYLIEPAVWLSEDDRDALWLFAWSYRETHPHDSYAYANV